uniref:Uncharacterized LOC109515277 n=1 Tax=Hippocampus comes TaxID=109280 RepID=A0A3Q3DKT0_HIPCM
MVRFEVVTSEASYCRSLDIVVEHFVKSKTLGVLLTTQDRNWLFSRSSAVLFLSFLAKLEERLESDIMHFTVCDIIARHCQRFKMVYVPYLTNQSYQDATYQRLMNENPGFKRIVEKLERSPVCQRLPLRSFLVLPFQRITRIKLLVQVGFWCFLTTYEAFPEHFSLSWKAYQVSHWQAKCAEEDAVPRSVCLGRYVSSHPIAPHSHTYLQVSETCYVC